VNRSNAQTIVKTKENKKGHVFKWTDIYTQICNQKNSLNVVAEDASRSHREHQRYAGLLAIYVHQYNKRTVYYCTPLQVPASAQTLAPLFTGPVSAHRHSLLYFPAICICTQTLTPLFTGTCICTQALPDFRNFELNFILTKFLKH
jgi:hypothetical protein